MPHGAGKRETQTEPNRMKIDLYREAASLKRALRFANILSLCGEIYGVEAATAAAAAVEEAGKMLHTRRLFPGKTLASKYTAR